MIIYGGGKSGRIYRNVQPLAKVDKPEPEKECRACGKVLPLSEFALNKTAKDRRDGICKKCKNKRTREAAARKKAEAEKERDTCGTCNGFTPATSDEKYGACTKRLTDKQAHPMKDRRQAACGYHERKKGNNG